MKDNQVQQGLQEILSGCSTKRKNNAFPVKWVYAIFQRFNERYLTKWTSAIEGLEKEAANEWASQLRGINATQVSKGLNDWDGDWPPSAPEFRKCCLGIKKNEHGLNYIPEIYRSENRIFTAEKFRFDFENDKLRLEEK